MKTTKIRTVDKEENKSAESKALSGISEFILKYRKVLIIALAVIVVGLIVLAVCLISSDNKQNSLQVQVDKLQTEVGDLFNSEYTPEEYTALVDEITSVEKAGGKTYAGVKASYILGLTYFNAEDYQNAYDSFILTYGKNLDSYLSPLALFNAAVAKDNLGSQDEALALYERVVSEFGYDTGVAPKALFNSARIHLAKGETDLAKSTFQQIIDQYTSVTSSATSEYVALSRNAMLTL